MTANRLTLLGGVLLTIGLAALHPGQGFAQTEPVAACTPGERDTRRVATGFNVNALFWEGLYGDASMHEALRSLAGATLRWPGGTESDYFDWTTGRPVHACRYASCRTWDAVELVPPPLYQRFNAFSDGTPANWAKVGTAVGSPSLLVANLVTASPAEMLAWLGQATDAGLAINLVELGNEPYFSRVEGTDNNARAFPDATAFARSAIRLAADVRRRHPGVTLAHPAFVPRIDASTGEISDGHDARMLTWNDKVLEAGAAEAIDAFALHFYPQLPARGQQDTAEYLRRLAEWPRRYWEATRATPQWQALPADRRLWITEFNVSFARAPELTGTWIHGLYMAQFALLALEDPRVDQLVAHMLSGSATWQSVVHPGRTPDVPTPPQGQAYAATPTGVSLGAVGRVVNGSRCGAPAAAAAFRLPSGSALPVAWTSTGDAGRSTVLVNMNAVAVDYAISPAATGVISGTALHAEPLARVTSSTGIQQTPLTVRDDVVRLPPFSITVLTESRARSAHLVADEDAQLRGGGEFQ